ncbi:hypothetical protein [Butyrivibrio sp. XPD2006]|uniref:hypothetical protein n=1 Tax=Butyrivibrio sp. XPD2006 TaxID=1280668 RepID=UPI0003B60554|nr:hypothetical protein [Butyrivibrio sp. XPD2006]
MEKVYSIIIALVVSFVTVTGGMVDLPVEEAPVQKAAEQVADTTQTVGYGRILFVGDSRSVDMFSASEERILGQSIDGMTVYCQDAANYNNMVTWIDGYGTDNFDTLVTWMGCNNFGDFSEYGPYYDGLIAKGKTIVACTVGPTVDECLLYGKDYLYYPNANQINYNNSLVAWANKRGVKIIDLYSYISDSTSIYANPEDGIHYFPQPTTELWNYIKANLK